MTILELANSPIGFDFGNCFSQIGFFQNLDKETRRGDLYIDLSDPQSLNPNGIPSAFFYSTRYGNEPLVGEAAAKGNPKENCQILLKRKMNSGSVKIDGKSFKYEDMITAVIQHVMRTAENQLRIRQFPVTNKICLAYPVSFSYAELQKLVDLAQKATLSDGTHIEVIGTITEPAAAALDYLASISFTKPMEVLVYDLGGGTFDISRVKAYPELQRLPDGTEYYYDSIYNDGTTASCGHEFDARLKAILLKKAGKFASDRATQIAIDNKLEEIKRGLSNQTQYDPNIFLPDGTFMDMITRAEFEEASKDLVEITVNMVKEALKPIHGKEAPAHIVLTGGASSMPMAKEALEKALPDYKGRIHQHLPSKAISRGAARFGIRESTPLIQRTVHDIGICYTNEETGKDYIKTYIPAGTVIPVTSQDINGEALHDSQHVNFGINEAKHLNPDINKTTADYTEICSLSYDNKQMVKKGHKYISRISIDEKNLLTLTVWEPEVPSHKPQTKKCDVTSNIK